MARAYRRPMKRRARHKRNITYVTWVILIIAAAIIYNSTQNINNDPTVPTYSADQNEDGFYYYQIASSEDYYYTTNNLIGAALMSELNEISNNHLDLVRYADAKVLLALSDLDLEDPSKVWNIYNGDLVEAAWDGASWHREHVWPNSRLGIPRVDESERSQASDLHNLRAITPAINSSRSDRFYSDGSGEAGTTEDGGYYPGDEHKGDVARILFYMAVTYDFLILTDDGLEDETYHYTMDGVKMGKLSLLLEWHKEDPVSDFERQRNEVIFEHQKNRNPFIDRPEYAHLIWEGKTISQLTKPAETHAIDTPYYLEKKVWSYDLLHA